MSLRLTNSSMPYGPSSRPTPERSYHRKGVRRRHLGLVDPHHAGVQAVRDLERAGSGRLEDRAAEAERRVVGQGDRLVDAADLVDHGNGTEELLAERTHLLGDVGEHRGLNKAPGPSRRVPPVRTVAPLSTASSTWAIRPRGRLRGQGAEGRVRVEGVPGCWRPWLP